MKASLFASIVAFAASALAAPVPDKDISEAVNYILTLEGGKPGVSAYSEEVDAADAAKVLGRRDKDISEAVNYILTLEGGKPGVSAYSEEVDAANAAGVMG